MKEIISLQHPLVKHLVKLRQDKTYRKECSKILVSGNKLIAQLPKTAKIHTLLVEKGVSQELSANHLVYVTPEILKKVTGLAAPETLAAEIEMPQTVDLTSCAYLLVLDGIADPGNLGTLLRSASALGWDGLFLTHNSTDPFNEKALRAAKGATFTLPWQTGSIEELKHLLKNRAVFAAEALGQDVRLLQPEPPLALILGNEAHGITALLKKMATSVGIPMQRGMESLNVGAAGSILMHFMKKL